MKHSNVFGIPRWMQNLRAQEPEGKRTPDQVASSLELAILLHGPDVEILKEIIAKAVPQVPLKRQPFIRSLAQGDVLANCQVFINKANEQLASLEVSHAPEPSGESDLLSTDSYGGDDWDSPCEPRPSSRGLRALRSAKRQQA